MLVATRGSIPPGDCDLYHVPGGGEIYHMSGRRFGSRYVVWIKFPLAHRVQTFEVNAQRQ
ncbi:hypothetical protein Mycsm_05289 [Mycobacterium sp. JS623]|nr:hypothetical protein Mycsm_05289 [Mycobacterium sp. JS623]